ncbi:MAG: xanthine dehydrogenase family protein molybdopterin-binding subunit [Gammaproteobacteria bacterium]|jgi:4-hydroxybenzoyl-CoA reductase subunit alpha|nr:xanthine dehydrogenase family protein molybdopterin-binding subunit [Gammaproteobacteria bacterium]MDP6696073.1 xanthine dehydrogenase family protein molybdopterin-binding subunit [Gammaproteobacteria bacterium]MDP7041467.1 xanthine dehydrogenase family protein molybdopterin-binding subunit [Gammaproteobacteria bacterium]
MARVKEDLAVVGKNWARLDGADKVTGRSLFADDVRLPGMLYAKVVRSPHAHARILDIDISKAAAVPGVKAIITPEDGKDIWIGMNQPLLPPDGIVKYVGHEVVAIAATSERIAARAAELVEIEYETLPSLSDPRDAIKEGAIQLHEKGEGNVGWEVNLDHGDPDKVFAECDVIREDEFITNASHNCYAEYHVCVCDFSQAGKLVVYTPTQTAILFQKALAAAFEMEDSDVRMLTLNTGGGFTGRTSVRPHHFIAALLSRKAGRPVRLRSAGDEEFIMCRAGGKVYYKLRSGATKDGKLKVIEADLLFDNGAYIESQMIVTTLTSKYLHVLYPLEASRYRGRLAYTNHLPYYFHHGGGLAQMQFALGQHMDALAHDLGMDSVEFSLLNGVEEGYTTADGTTTYYSCGLKECIEKTAELAGWKDKYGKLPKYKGIGIGIGAMASGAKGVFKHDTSAAMIQVNPDGKASLFIGLPDMGQSSHTTMAIIAAEVLGIAPTDIKVVSGDTDTDPFDVGAFTQRGTFTTGNATKNAALDARGQLAVWAAGQLECDEDDLVWRNHEVYAKDNPDEKLRFRDVADQTLNCMEGRFVMGRGFYNSPIKAGSMAFSFGAQIAEVTVDPSTGVVTVDKMTASHDVGRAINPRIVEGQMDGQIFSGMSQVLYEETIMEDGQVMNPSRLDYKMPRAYEMPEVDHIIVETIDPNGPFGAKEVGEGPIVCTMQAIANAVTNAIGARITEMPLSPWRVVKAIKD